MWSVKIFINRRLSFVDVNNDKLRFGAGFELYRPVEKPGRDNKIRWAATLIAIRPVIGAYPLADFVQRKQLTSAATDLWLKSFAPTPKRKSKKSIALINIWPLTFSTTLKTNYKKTSKPTDLDVFWLHKNKLHKNKTELQNETPFYFFVVMD